MKYIYVLDILLEYIFMFAFAVFLVLGVFNWRFFIAAGAALVLFCRAYVVTDMANADVVLVPALAVFLSAFFDSLKGLKLVFAFLGRHSTNIWLIHTFFCYYFLGPAKLVYCTRCVWIDLAILLALSLGASALLELFYNYLGKLLRRLSRGRIPTVT